MESPPPRWQQLKPLWLPFILLLTFIRAYQSWPHEFAGVSWHTLGEFVTGPIYQGLVVLYIGLLLSPFTTPTRFGWAGWWILDASLCTFILSQGFKHLINLPRPTGGSHGFPSGHTMFAFTLAWLMFKRYPRLAPFWFGLAAAVGWSRVEVNAHFPYQVYCGLVIGLVVGYFITNGPKGVLLPRYARRKAPAASV